MTAYKHAALMLQYAKDAAETDKPWERWEWRDINTNQFITCNQHPSWSLNGGFRRKPQVIRVGRHTFTEPIRFNPEQDTIYWVVSLKDTGYSPTNHTWRGDKIDLALLKARVVHLTQENAQTHADVLNAICRGDVE